MTCRPCRIFIRLRPPHQNRTKICGAEVEEFCVSKFLLRQGKRRREYTNILKSLDAAPAEICRPKSGSDRFCYPTHSLAHQEAKINRKSRRRGIFFIFCSVVLPNSTCTSCHEYTNAHYPYNLGNFVSFLDLNPWYNQF